LTIILILILRGDEKYEICPPSSTARFETKHATYLTFRTNLWSADYLSVYTANRTYLVGPVNCETRAAKSSSEKRAKKFG